MRYEWESLQRKEGVVEKREADLRKDESVELTVATVATISGGLVAMGLYVFVIEPLWVLPWLEWMTPGILYRVRTREALVALSFDDGPHAVFTAEVLEILDRYGAKATFFLIGERAERHPELVERIRAAGHEIGNHCWRDGTVLGHSRKRFAEELKKTELAVAPSKSGPLRKAGPTTTEANGRGGADYHTAKTARLRRQPLQRLATIGFAGVSQSERFLPVTKRVSSRLTFSHGESSI